MFYKGKFGNSGMFIRRSSLVRPPAQRRASGLLGFQEHPRWIRKADTEVVPTFCAGRFTLVIYLWMTYRVTLVDAILSEFHLRNA